MPTHARGGGVHIRRDVSLNSKSISQNVRSATMAEPSAPLASHILSHMILVLVLSYCMTGCLGGLQSPAAVFNTPDSADIKNISEVIVDAVGLERPAPPGVLYSGDRLWLNSQQDNARFRFFSRNHDRTSRLRKLLENLTKLKQFHRKDSLDTLVTFTNQDDKVRNSRDKNFLEKLWSKKHGLQKTYYSTTVGKSFSSLNNQLIGQKPVEIAAKLDLFINLQEDNLAQNIPTDQITQPLTQLSASDVLSEVDEPILIGRRGAETINNYELTRDWSQGKQDEEVKDTKRNEDTFKDSSPEEKSYSENYLIAPENQETSDVNMNSNQDGQEDHGDRLSEEEEYVIKVIPLEGADDTVRMFGTSSSRALAGSHNEATLESLIHKTVKQMENIMKKRIASYHNVYDDNFADQEVLDKAWRTQRSSSSGSATAFFATSLEQMGSDKNDVPDGEETSDELSTPKEPDHVSNVRDAVGKALASRTVPRDPQFWRNVSNYLDSNSYLSRTRRSPNRGRKRNGPQYVHLTITYGHVMPCEYKDRFYCMNGGTCVFVGALDIKTCRCPIGYTGVRCEMIDQEYILSLLTNTLIFS